MDHNKYKEQIILFIYNELTAEELQKFESHLQLCNECSKELDEQKKLISSIQKKHPLSDRLLNEARRELSAALRVERTKASLWEKLKEKFSLLYNSNYALAFGGTAILLIGFFLGYLFFNKNNNENNLAAAIDSESQFSYMHENIQISNVRFIDSDASDGEVEFMFEAVKPVKIKGNLNDSKIQNILAASMINEQNPGIRLNTINAINSNQSLPEDSDIKTALISVAKFDENPGVRREAIQVLKKMNYDEEIKQAFLYVLKTDTVSGLRIEAINSLVKAKQNGHQFDEEALNILREKMMDDENSYIKYQAKTVLQEKYQ